MAPSGPIAHPTPHGRAPRDARTSVFYEGALHLAEELVLWLLAK